MLEINRKLVSKTLIQCCRERLMDIVLSWYVVLPYSALFALRKSRVDLMTFQTID